MELKSAAEFVDLSYQELTRSFPVEVAFVDCKPSAAVRFQIEEQLEKLRRHAPRALGCKVAIRIPHKNKRSRSRLFHIHIVLDLPGKRLAVTREPEQNNDHTSIGVAIRDAFHKLTRQVEDHLA